MLRIALSATVEPLSAPAGVDRCDVKVNPDGSVTVTADANTMGRLAGRDEIGTVAPVQAYLRERIATAWYRDDCRGYR